MTVTTAANHEWRLLKKIYVRFSAVYFILYISVFPAAYIPFGLKINHWYTQCWDAIVSWLNEYFFKASYHFSNDYSSSDGTYNYLQLIAIVLLASVICIIWSAADRKRKSYDALLYWVMVILRYFLAFTMIDYGCSKIFYMQFSPMGLTTLMSPYGQSFPQQLLWNFMGYSVGYNIFIGIGEITGGFLLLFRKTKLAGALITLIIVANVFALNLSYDVAVKLFSFHLLLIALFIAGPDLANLFRFLFLNQPANALDSKAPVPGKRWQRTALLIVKYGLILFVFFNSFQFYSGFIKLRSSQSKHPPLYGVYSTSSFMLNANLLPPLLTDTVRWHKLIIENQGYANVQQMNDDMHGYHFITDTAAKTISMFSFDDTIQKFQLHYFLPDTAHLVISGRIRGDSVNIRLEKFNLNDWNLIRNQFNWTHDYN